MKPLWRQMLENGVSKENIERCIITKSSKGSPYEEVSEVSGEQEISFAVNPYIRMTKIVPGLETDDTFLPEIAKTITCIEYDTGMDVSVIVRQEMRKEIESGCFGPDIREQWIKLTRTQQSETLRNLYRFYGQRQEIVSFVYEVLAKSDPELGIWTFKGEPIVREFNVIYLKHADVREKMAWFL